MIRFMESLYTYKLKTKPLSKLSILLIVLFEMGFNINYNIVGQISISELFVVVYTAIFIWNSELLKIKEFKTFLIYYLLLIFFQILSELAVGNSANNALRGISVTIVSFCHLFFALKYLIKDRRYIFIFILGIVISNLVFGSPITMDDASMSDDPTSIYLKFYLAPLLTNIGLLASFFLKGKFDSIVFLILGIVFIVLGARSSGMMAFLTGLLVYFRSLHINLTKKNWKIYLIPIALIAYGGYYFYVDSVLNGDIKSGNSEQLLRTGNPYNPLNLLITGRPEVFAGSIAFTDHPLFGCGAWCSDLKYGYKYHAIATTFANSNFNIANMGDDVIPSHSVVIGYAMQNGIVPLILIILILGSSLKYAFKSYRDTEPIFLVPLILFIMETLWNGLFSPISHFRLSLPLYMSFMFANYVIIAHRNGTHELNK